MNKTTPLPEHEQIHIREATAGDVSALAPLFQQEAMLAQQQAGYYELDPEFDWNAWTQAATANKNRIILLAEQSNQILGFTHVRIVEHKYISQQHPKSLLARFQRKKPSKPSFPLKPLSYAVIEGCFVAPSFRRKGVGNKLVLQTLERLQSSGIRRVELGVLANNADAQPFWQQLGFETFRVLMHRRT
jgi:ribosomal protein S18 acetylase RimI-like enzyme